MQSTLKILVTGGAGYIGSHLVSSLVKKSFDVIVFDNLSTGFQEAVDPNATFILGDITKTESLRKVFIDHKIDVVMHLAGVLNIAESFQEEEQYELVNFVGTKNVVRLCEEYKVSKIIFSSSCTVYGNQLIHSLKEDLPPAPISPYGRSKMKCEEILLAESVTKDIRSIIFRYFNVAGASRDLSNGQRTVKVTQLIHGVSKAAVGDIASVAICGSDYETPDGTCVRDYIHIEDLVDIHLLGLEYLLESGSSQILNCGSGKGYSVAEVLKIAQGLAQNYFEVKYQNRRPGDPGYLVSNNSKIRSVLGWQPTHSNIENIISTAIGWEKQSKSPGDF